MKLRSMDPTLVSSFLLILLSTAFGVAGQTALKLGVSQPGVAETATGVWSIVGLIFKSPLMMLGLVLDRPARWPGSPCWHGWT